MHHHTLFAKGLSLAALALASQAAIAIPYLGEPTWLGTLTPKAPNILFYENLFPTEVGSGVDFTDSWVVDVADDGIGSASANFTQLGRVDNFRAELYIAAAGTKCDNGPGGDGTCEIVRGDLVAEGADDGDSQWTLGVGVVPAGRYILDVLGTTNEFPELETGYNGTASVAQVVPEPTTYGLIALGLLALGATSRRSRA